MFFSVTAAADLQLQDADFRKIAREWYGKYNGRKIVLVTHQPPFGNKLDLMGSRHVGNKDFTAFILRIKAKLAVSVPSA